MNINESKNYSILYHYIPLYNLGNMLRDYDKSGKMLLKSNVNVNSEYVDRPKAVISLSRNPIMNSQDLMISKQICRITLDAKKISTRYKLVPYKDPLYDGDGQEREERLITREEGNWKGDYNIHVPDQYVADITGCVMRIDILEKVPKMVRLQGYVAWSQLYDRHGMNPKKFFDNDKNRSDIDKDHETQIKNLYFLIKEIKKLPFNVQIVKKFTNYKYQDRYLNNYTRMGFIFNRYNKKRNI